MEFWPALSIHHVNYNGNVHRKEVANLTAWVLMEENRARASSPSACCA
jgi:hypothetical protein